MRPTGARAYTRATTVPKMPTGLVELMEGLTKDVLKSNPTNIYEFCANHLEKLLEIRDGPSSKKSLTLEEKISEAQKKVRERAQERQQRFDNEILSDVIHDETEIQQPIDKEGNSTKQELMSNLRAPVHHDQDLTLASEVEISQESFTDNSLTKDSSDVYDEIPISKSSTFSSVSKSTVIDLLGNDHETCDKAEIDDGIEGLKINIENTDEPMKGNDKADVKKDNITIDENIDIFSCNDGKKQEDIQLSFIETRSVIKEDLALIIQDPAKELDITKQPEKENPNETSEKPKIHTNSDSEHEVIVKPFDEVNEIIKEDVDITHQIEPDQADNSTTEHITDRSNEVIKVDAEDFMIKTKDDNITADNPVVLLSTSDVNNKVQVADIVATYTENASDSLEDTALPKSLTDSDITAVDNHSKNADPDEGYIQVTEEIIYDNPQTNVQQSHVTDVKMNHEEIKPTSVTVEKITSQNGTESANAHTTAHETIEFFENSVENNTTENSTKIMLTLNESNSPADEAKVEEAIQNSNFTSVPRTSSVENSYDSSVMGSDLLKTEDEIQRCGNENGQNNMDLETAAVTIQKVFRSFLFKSRNSTFEDITNDEVISLEEDNVKKEEYFAAANLSQERRPLGITRMDTVLQTVNEEKSLSLSTDDSSTLSSAATTIQAHVRGFLVRNKLNSYRTVSTNSLVNSNEMLDTDTEQQKSKTVLNIHIVPEEGNYLSRDESLITSMDLSLDGSPPSSINLHPLSYDLVSERRKLLKREDAIQSVSPPSNNSGKLSEDSVKEVLINENDVPKTESNIFEKVDHSNTEENSSSTLVTAVSAVMVRDMSNEQDEKANTEQARDTSLNEQIKTDNTEMARDASNEQDKIANTEVARDTSLNENVKITNTEVVHDPSNEQDEISDLEIGRDTFNEQVEIANTEIGRETSNNKQYEITKTQMDRDTSIKHVEIDNMQLGRGSSNEQDEVANTKIARNTSNKQDEIGNTEIARDTSSTQDEMDNTEKADGRRKSSMSDESDVITPFEASPRSLVGDFESTSKLWHSGEFHDVVLPTKVSRGDTSVVREFKNALAYILLWNTS